MIFSVQKFRHYLLRYKFTSHINHDALKYMINKPQLSGRVARWVLLLQEFDFTVNVRPGKSHQNADFLSRINDTINPESVDDSFPDAHIFSVKDGVDVMDIIPAEYADIIYYLTKRTFPNNYTTKKKLG